jgi:hypothetical protein
MKSLSLFAKSLFLFLLSKEKDLILCIVTLFMRIVACPGLDSNQHNLSDAAT